MPAPTPVVKYVDGYFVDADQRPESGTVTAALSHRIVDVSDRTVVEKDETITATLDADGRFVLALRPNNQPGDAPQNSYWTITEPSGHQETIVVPYDHASGGTPAAAINYLSLIAIPVNLPEPGDPDLADAVAELQDIVAALLDADDEALEDMTPPQATTLVDLAKAAATVATTSTDGLMSSEDKTKLDGAAGSGLVYTDANGRIKVPGAADPLAATPAGEGRIWVSTTDGFAKIRVLQSNTTLAPALDTPVWQASADVNVTGTTNQTLASLDVEANSLYEIRGIVGYRVAETVDLTFGFGGIPTGATLVWGYLGPEATRAVSTSTGSVNNTRRTGTSTLTFGGVGTTAADDVLATVTGTLRVGTTAGTLTILVKKENAGTNGVIRTGSIFTLQRVL